MEENITNIEVYSIQNKIITIRNLQVIIDRDLADLFQIETKRLNEQVKRNAQRFPEGYHFQLTPKERIELVANCDRLKNIKHSSSNPFVFTEHGVAMISAILRTEIAIKISIQIINAFIQMRNNLNMNQLLDQRINFLEKKQYASELKFEEIFNALENKKIEQHQGIFYNGQIFDSYVFINEIIREAKNEIILLDNYVDDITLVSFSKKIINTKVKIYTNKISKQLEIDSIKFNEQYTGLSILEIKNIHDRFLIIDREKMYHLGASLKDLGKKWFAFSRMDGFIQEVLKRLN